MATTVDEVYVARPHSVIQQTKYEYDPDTAYADPEGQAINEDHGSAQSPPSLTIATNVPAPSIPAQQFSQADSNDLDYLRSTYGIAESHPLNDVIVKYDFEPTRADEIAVKSGALVCVIHTFHDRWTLVKNGEGKRGVVPSDYLQLEDSSEILRSPNPRTPSSSSRLTPLRSPVSTDHLKELSVSGQASKRKSRKGVLGLLELLHFSKRKQEESQHQPKFSLPSPSLVTSFNVDSNRKSQSVLKSLSFKGKQEPEFPRRVRFDSSLNGNILYENTSDSTSIITTVANQPSVTDNLWETDSESDSSVPPFSPLPSYDDVFHRPLPPIPSGTLSQPSPCSGENLKSQHASFVLGPKAHEEGKQKMSVEVYVEPSSPVDSADPSVMNPAVVVVEPSYIPEAITSENIIYRNLLSLLVKRVSSTDPLRITLHEYIVTLRALDPVSSVLQSRDYRANLLQVASALEIFEDPVIREALQKDEYEIAGLLEAISHSEESKRAVLQLEGDDAQKFLDYVQDVLDKAYLLSQEDNTRAKRLLVRLSETCDKLPSSLFIKGVERADAHATFGGGFGDVYRATYNGECVALKRMRIFLRDPGLPNIRRRFCKEALIWQQLKSPFVVPFLGIDAETFPSFLCMVSPWMRHGTVLKYLADHGRNGVNKRLYEIAQGLSYLHSQKIVHGDLRGANVLINEEWQACLTDFGLTVFDDATAVTFTSRREGSVRWMAPELHDPNSFGLDRFRLTPETDIYAFGCVCLELCTGRAPFADVRHDATVILKVMQGGRPSRPLGEGGMSDQLWKMVEMCWSQHFADRLKTDEVVEFTRKLSDPNTKILDLPVFSQVPESLLLSTEDEGDVLEVIAAEDILVKKSLANALYLQGDPLSSSTSVVKSEKVRLPPALPRRQSSLSTPSPSVSWLSKLGSPRSMDTNISLNLNFSLESHKKAGHSPTLTSRSGVSDSNPKFQHELLFDSPHTRFVLVHFLLAILSVVLFVSMSSFT